MISAGVDLPGLISQTLTGGAWAPVESGYAFGVRVHPPGYRHPFEGGGRCLFCGKTRAKVDQTVSGPGVCICNECLERVTREMNSAEQRDS